MNIKLFSIIVVIILALAATTSSGASRNSVLDSSPQGPECWALSENISYTGEIRINPNLAIQRVSTYEIHDDDSVNPNHMLTNLPFYSTYTWGGSLDVEWLVLEGNFTTYTIDNVNHSVTFYNLQDWLHIVYRTHNFIQRTTDQIRFCVIGQNGGSYYDTQARVLYPANYQFQSATPAGYSIPAAGEIRWNFGSTAEFQVDTYFAGLGPDRPLLDFPVDYDGRKVGSINGFSAAYKNRITALFDHQSPNYTYDTFFLPYTGVKISDDACPAGVVGFTCYDGHDGYDIDDRCPSKAPCSDPTAVYPAADGDISVLPWHNLLGCRLQVDHGNGWTTTYNHLRDSLNNHSCDGILIRTGQVTRLQQIGIIGKSGTTATHLHFVVRHNGIVVDPSGWEPNQQKYPDPWSQVGATSYPMWLYSIRSTLAFDPNLGGQISSPTHQVLADIPPGYYNEPLIFNLSEQPVSPPPVTFTNTGYSFSLTAADTNGNFIHQLNLPITLQVSFVMTDVVGIDLDTLSIYSWNTSTNMWDPEPTSVDWGAMKASAQVNHLSTFALIGRSENLRFLPIINR